MSFGLNELSIAYMCTYLNTSIPDTSMNIWTRKFVLCVLNIVYVSVSWMGLNMLNEIISKLPNAQCNQIDTDLFLERETRNWEIDVILCHTPSVYIYIYIYILCQCIYKQRVLMHRHQGLNVRHGLCHIYMRYLYIYELFIAFVCFVVCSLL